MITKTNFEDMLCKSAELFSFSKKHTDLFVLLQTNTVTYRQLALSRLHGTSLVSARLALKRLEEQGYIQAKSLDKHNNEKYYFLTTSGRNWIRSAFPQEFLEQMAVNWTRRPPTGSQQILHRIRTNDFYFTYIAANESIPRMWRLEHPLPAKTVCGSSSARCDALLSGINRDYYIEQDNNSQSETVIRKKISQYTEAGFFNVSLNSWPLLIFCLSFPSCTRTEGAAPFSTYRLLLKFCKLWKLLEEKHGIELDYGQFYNTIKVSSLGVTVSNIEFLRFDLLHRRHPEVDTLIALTQLKNAYLADSQDLAGFVDELDIFYRKRLKSHYSALYKAFPNLLPSARRGIPLFAVPNHRLAAMMPFIMAEELSLATKLRMYLLQQNLILDGWRYESPIAIPLDDSKSLYFYAGLSHPYLGYLIIEIPYQDLSSLPRIGYNIKFLGSLQNVSFLFLTDKNFFSDLQTACWQNGCSKKHTVLAADIYHLFSQDGTACPIYRFENDKDIHEVYFETDLFYGKLRTICKEETL